ncbi:ectonucleotide pyrophosphatase/phosphodiesterase family member 7-like [Asterias rubens]|uniref:ectonucleotide pyrophosphatase/phosphodiesterase family member 7-like n=1 Tax=Asterias rubens TaxID=7604 RepID=UPI0014556255|nr:ectonucleotide pyrophosphatase/phosphodiesterase family member 7-like [Asterias rubens]
MDKAFCLGLLVLLTSLVNSQQKTPTEKILFLLVDGLRWDRLGYEMPALDKIAQNGVRAEWLDGVFVTKSAPSMFSIATGLYVESHGVVHNLAFDAATHEMTGGWSETMNSTWWFNFAGEPLWITAITQGLSAGSFMYPGGQTPIDGILPNCYIGYSTKVYQNLIDRAEVVFDWLYEDNLDVVFLYVGKLDDALHYTGFSEETERVAGEVNELISYILAKIAVDSNVGDNLNFIVASDHGMAKISGDKALSLFDYIDESKVGMLVSDGGSIFQIQPVQGALEEVYSTLSRAHPSINIFKKEEFPSRFHYGNNPRNLALIGYMDIGWTMFPRVDNVSAAGHGYDNDDMTMKSLFYAQGPSFRHGYLANHFESVNIYSLMCEILGVVPAPNNGSRNTYKDMLVSEHPTRVTVTCGATALNGCYTAFIYMGTIFAKFFVLQL